jgi:SAM-dependent methyltransferase
MQRSLAPEILDRADLANEIRERAYRDLVRINRVLGNWRVVMETIRDSGATSVLDIGCGAGALLAEIHRRRGLRVIGVDLHPPAHTLAHVVRADAIHDPLPEADVAIAVFMVHHLSEDHLADLIRNVGRSCRRFLILDPVRHWLPLLLYRMCIGPFVYEVNRVDGADSVRKSFTAPELRRIISDALGTAATFRHTVAPAYIRQVADITY